MSEFRIPITICFAGATTFLVTAQTHVGAVDLALDAFQADHPDMEIQSILIMDETDLDDVKANGETFVNLEEVVDRKQPGT